MRIAIVHYSKPPVIGGVERVIGEQAAALRALGHEVTIFDKSAEDREAFDRWLDTASPARPGARLPSAATEPRPLTPYQRVHQWLSSPDAPSPYFEPAKEITRHRHGLPHWQQEGKLVIVHNVFTMPFDPEWTRRLIELTHARPDIRWINWVHDVRWADAIPRAAHIAVSEHRRKDYARHTKEPVHVIPNGCDFASLLGLTGRVHELRLERAPLVLLHPARFVRRKNIELGLRVLEHLPRALHLVTGAPDPHQKDGIKYFRELKRLAKSLGVTSRVRFLGEKEALSDDDLRGLYLMADALFFPSTQEGYGLPLIEAAMHGVPVFCSDIPPHREVAPRASFFKLTTSPKTLARKIQANAEVKARQARRSLMARLDWETIIRKNLEPVLSAI